jgi:DNA-binding transcriptional LysR family regulator
VTLAHLRLIRDVAHSRSVSKAARLNDMSQSAVSQALQEAERESGVSLFDRSTRPLRVTAAGKMYLDYCRDVLRRHEELQNSLALLKKQTSGTVRLASIYSVGLTEMSDIEKHFARRFPDAELQVSYLRPERVWGAVEEDQADLGLLSYAESSREIIALPWRQEEMVVAVAPQHPLAKRKHVKADALEGEPFIAFDDDLPIQNDIERYLREHRVNVEISMRFDNLEMIKHAVAHHAGVSILPQRAMREDLAQGRIVGLRLDPADLHRPLGIIHRRRKTFNEVGRGLLEILQSNERPHAA